MTEPAHESHDVLSLQEQCRQDPWRAWLMHEPQPVDPDFSGVPFRVVGWLAAGVMGLSFWGGAYVLLRGLVA